MILERYENLISTYIDETKEDNIFFIMRGFYIIIKYFLLFPFFIAWLLLTIPFKICYKKYKDKKLRDLRKGYHEENIRLEKERNKYKDFLKEGQTGLQKYNQDDEENFVD